MRNSKAWSGFAFVSMLLLLGAATAEPSQKDDESAKAGNRAGGGKGARGNRGLNTDQIVERLLSFDKNKDGKLTKDELPERMQDLIAKGDANKDGALDKDEIKALAAKLATEGFAGGAGGRGAQGGGFRGALAGFGGFGGGLTFLAGQKSVQDELKMTTEQAAKVKELAGKQREDLAGLRDLSREEHQKKMEERTQAEAKAIAELLKPDQLKRLKQISWQQQGTRALSNTEVADALKLSTEQKDRIKVLSEASLKEMRDLVGGGNPQETRKKMADLRKSTDEKVTAVLTADQKTKLSKLTGEAFKGEITRPAIGGFGGRRGRPGAGTEQSKRDPPKATEPAKTEVPK
jgi:hypothetical protein